MNAQLEKLSNPMLAAVESFKVCDELVMAEGQTLPDALRVAFARSLSDVRSEVDTFIAADTDADADLVKIEQMMAFLKARRAYIEERQKALRELAREAIEALPGGPLRGALGSIYTQRTRAVETAWGDKALTPADIDFHAIPKAFVRTKVTHAVDAVAVGQALKDGIELSWAWMKEKTTLAIRTKKQTKEEI